MGGQDAAPNWPELKRLVEANEVHGVIVTNPLNPTGKVYSSEEIHMLLGLADSHGLFVIFDVCYLDMVFDGNKHVSPFITGLRDNVVACRGFSKCLGCQSWRCGYAISTPSTLLGMMTMMDPLFICANWTQHALGEYFRDHTEDFLEHCDKLNGLLQEIGHCSAGLSSSASAGSHCSLKAPCMACSSTVMRPISRLVKGLSVLELVSAQATSSSAVSPARQSAQVGFASIVASRV